MSGITVESLLDRRFILGEGPGYDSRNKTMFWVDIKTGSLCIYDPAAAKLQEIQTGQYLGAAVPSGKEGYLAAMSTGVYHVDDNGLTLICRPPEIKENHRINDGKCDPKGRFLFGTMTLLSPAPPSSLFRLDPDGNCRPMLSEVRLSNGLAWSLDGKSMYYIDTPEQGVDAFDFDMDEGHISNRRRILNITEGHPDGMTIDAEGKLWIALWGGGKVIRYDPANNEILSEIKVPATHVSSCAFVGENLDQLLITSSGEGFEEPTEGRVFIARPGPCGTATEIFNGA